MTGTAAALAKRHPETRAVAMARFLAANGWSEDAAIPLAADASFRRYFRLSENGHGAVLMDAPPQYERPDAYVAVAEILRRFGLSAPGAQVMKELGIDAEHVIAAAKSLD